MSRRLAPALQGFILSSGVRPPVYSFRVYRPTFSSKTHGFSNFCPKYLSLRSLHTHIPLTAVRVVNVPPFAESVTEGDIVWKKAIGDRVKEDDLVAEIETDKTNVPVPAPCSGVITELLVEDGGKVVPGQEVFKIDDAAAAGAQQEKPDTKPDAAATTPPASTKSTSAEPKLDTPKPDAKKSSEPSKPASPPPPPPSSSMTSVPIPVGDRGEQRVKMSRMRLRIAQRLKDAQNTCAMLTTFNEIDLSNLLELRNHYKDTFQKKHGIKLGMMSTFAKASAVALRDQPAVNAVIDGNDIIYRDYIDISIAVATPKGLVVPVLRNVDRMNYLDIEREIFELGQKAREGKLAVEDMDGGTFTISNGGVYGSLFGTPIINPPQSAILGLYGVFDRPVAHKGQVVIRPMMYVALTYDHRLIDGREAVTFLRKVKEFVEDPRTFFLQL